MIDRVTLDWMTGLVRTGVRDIRIVLFRQGTGKE
jgi:hypothetical protein